MISADNNLESKFYRLDDYETVLTRIFCLFCGGPVTVKSNPTGYYFFVLDIKFTISFFILSNYYLLFLILSLYVSLFKEDVSSLVRSNDFFRILLPLDDHLFAEVFYNSSLDKGFCSFLFCVTLKSSNFYLISSSMSSSVFLLEKFMESKTDLIFC